MNVSPITVRAEDMGGTGNVPGMFEIMRRQINWLIQRDSATGENAVLSAAGCAIATTASQAKTVATATYRVNGVFSSKAATDNLWTFSGATLAASSWNKYLLCLNAAGTASVIACVPSTVSAAAVALPSYQTFQVAIIGTMTVATNSSTTFIPGTTLLNAAGVTTTFIDGFDNNLAPGSLIQTYDPTGPG